DVAPVRAHRRSGRADRKIHDSTGRAPGARSDSARIENRLQPDRQSAAGRVAPAADGRQQRSHSG
nr:hypothetical protein [Tanacetum cinerariifolium]